MIWFRENREAGWLIIGLGGAVLLGLVVLFVAHGRFAEVEAQLSASTLELRRLQSRHPFPSEANLATLKRRTVEYGKAVQELKREVAKAVIPATSLTPDEFQARLRDAAVEVRQKARAAGMKLPDSFFLGFEEFAAALPDNEKAPLLGQQLEQTKLLVHILIDAHIDELIMLDRIAKTSGVSSSGPMRADRPDPTGGIDDREMERTSIHITFKASPRAMRGVVNRIAGCDQQLFVIRALQVRNEQQKGPARRPMDTQNRAATAAAPRARSTEEKENAPLNFIVGTEHLRISATIDLVRFGLRFHNDS